MRRQRLITGDVQAAALVGHASRVFFKLKLPSRDTAGDTDTMLYFWNADTHLQPFFTVGADEIGRNDLVRMAGQIEKQRFPEGLAGGLLIRKRS